MLTQPLSFSTTCFYINHILQTFSPSWGGDDWKPTAKPTWNKPTNDWKPTSKPTWKGDDWKPTSKPTWNKPTNDWKPTAKPTWNKPTNDWKPTSKPTWKGDDWKPTSKPTWKGDDWKPTSKPTWNKPTNPSGVKRYEIYTAEENPVGHGNWDDHFWWKDIIASVRKECTAIFREDYKNVAKTIRLLFHDCKGHSEGYGCDGCVNLNHSDNKGLEDIMQELRPIVEKFEKYLSRADTWAICALTALGISTSSTYPMTFIGRQTCEDSDDIGNGGGYFDTYGDEVHTSALVHHFYKYFGFDDKCTVAAMGVHGISKMKPEISGHGNGHYSATWVKDASHMMSNEYFKGFKYYDWTYEVRDNVAYSEFGQKSQWYYGSYDPSRLVILNADVAMVWNFADYVDNKGNIYCKVSDNVEHHGYRGDPWNVPNFTIAASDRKQQW